MEYGHIKHIIKRQRPNVSLIENQPIFSLAKNCTVGYSSFYFSIVYWGVIKCDEPVHASYVCQKSRHIENTLVSATNTTCDDGWIMLDGTHKCYMLLKPKTNISFDIAQRICFEKHSDIFSFSSEYIKASNAGYEYMFNLMRTRYYTAYRKHLPSIIGASYVNKIFFGQLLHRVKPINSLAVILSIILPDKVINNENSRYIAVFTYLDSYCGISEYRDKLSPLYGVVDSSNQYLKSWSAKYRSCSQLINVDTVICEKKGKPFAYTHCTDKFFKCADGTCILSIYKCDHVNDCKDRSDENNCNSELKVNISLSSQYIHLPCELNKVCYGLDNRSILPIHHICDGIYSKVIFVEEKSICTAGEKTKINLLALTTNILFRRTLKPQSRLLLLTYLSSEMRKNIKQKSSSSPKTGHENISEIYERQQVSCSHNGDRVPLDQICKISIHILHTPCKNFVKRICGSILCAGMFKCKDYYCISMSAVCDGQRDCLYGDDEEYCTALVCPGFLKCRGEDRCVGHEEMCDGHPDCIYSFDDELICQTCPETCVCKGYMSFCFSVKSESGIIYAKGLEINGGNTSLQIFPLMLKNVLYIRVSSSVLKYITTIKTHDTEYSLLFVNISGNKLMSLDFLRNTIFSKILILDVSKNSIVNIKIRNIKLKYLTVMYINENPIKEISLGNQLYNLMSLHVTGVYYTPGIYINLPDNRDIIVSDTTFCCILYSTRNCKSKQVYKICFGLFDKIHVKYSFYTITMISSIAFIMQLFKINRDRPWVQSAKKHYILSKLNHVIADLFSTLYFLILICTDFLKVNIVLWRQENQCLILRSIFFISSYTSIVFKTMAIIIVTLKIIYPFKHQLRTFKYIPIAAILIWLSLFVLQIYYLFSIFDNSNTLNLDKHCSFFDCHNKSTYFHLLTSTIGLSCVLCILIAGLTTYCKAKQTLLVDKMISSGQTISFTKVALKMIKPVSFELCLRILIFAMHAYKYTFVSSSQQLCLLLLLYIIPANLTAASLFNIMTL